MRCLAIDPGILTGWALVEAGSLVDCGLGENFPKNVQSGLIECPQVYRAAKSEADPQDLITLAVRVGRYQERLEARGVRTSLVLPTSWKGQIAKVQHHPRIFQSLSPSERTVAVRNLRGMAEKKAENVWDAIGLAKWAVARNKF